MAQVEIRLPKMGESVTEATITNWLKEVGDTVEMDEPLVEVATDKVDNELPSEAEGTLIEIRFEKDQVAQVGDVIAIILQMVKLLRQKKLQLKKQLLKRLLK